MKVNNLLFYIFFLLCLSCVKQHDDELSMLKTSYSGNKIRFDGYYYSCFNYLQYKIYGYRIFYRNGVVVGFDSSTYFENVFDDKKEFERIKNNKTSWGLFQVKNDTINIQSWKFSEGYTRYTLDNNSHLRIANDTTLCYVNGDTLYFEFFKSDFRPDSTNIFIK